MALAGKALVVIWNDILAEMREDFFEWHPREHMVERLGIPGFLRGRRCISVDGGVEFLTMYEIRGGEVLTSDVYTQRLTNPTPWSTKTLPAFRNNVRGACQIEFSDGYAMGGHVLTLRFEALDGREDALIAALVQDVMPNLTALPRITGAHLVKNDVSLTSGNSGNQRGRTISLPQLIVIIEGSDAQAVRAVGEKFLSNVQLEAHGAKSDVIRSLYQLEYSIQNLAS